MLKPGDGEGRDLFEYRLRKFRGEIDALTRFRHPHIVGILDQGALTDDEPFLVMEFIEGVPLSSVMNNQRMEFARVARIMRQAGEALDYAHRRGVFHRDLKPENMMVRTAEGEDFVSLIDFGLATVQEWPHKVRSSGSPNTYLVGTPEYMAPEQIRKDPSAASDIWAQGVIAY